MNLYPAALAKASAVFMFCIALLNSSINIMYFQLSMMQLVVPLTVSPFIAAISGYVFAYLYNYFVPSLR